MSALSFARQAFGREKPHSSITDWVDILTAINVEEEAYDGIPELVDSINLQSTGPAEASRALRKKLKHGNTHQQYRSLVLLKALVENGGQKFQSTFADGHMTDALKAIASDASGDRRVKKKLTLVLASWRDQYKDDPTMSVVAGLYRQCIGFEKRIGQQEMAGFMGMDLAAEEKKRMEKQEAKQKIIQANILAKEQREREAKQQKEDKHKKKRIPFDFEKDKPKVLASIVEASQASSNLQNAVQLVNLDTDRLETNPRVQECLEKARQARKPVVRYIQLVENEDVIGTLIETNDRIVAALETYERLAALAAVKAAEQAELENNGSTPKTTTTSLLPPTNQTSPKGKDRASEAPANLHPDLEDLSFGALGSSTNNLAAPMRPSTLSDDEEEADHRGGSLSDYSDYESSSEETHKNYTSGPSSKRNFVTVSDNEDDFNNPSSRKAVIEDDPFADPFADK